MLSFLKRDSTLMIALDWLAQLVLINLHWLSISGVFWLLLAVQVFLTVPQAVLISPLAAVAAFALLLPATAAMFQDIHAWQDKEPLRWRIFWQNWRAALRTHWRFNLLGAAVMTILPLYWRLLANIVFARALILGILVTVLAATLNLWVRGWHTPMRDWAIGRSLLSAAAVLVILGLTFQLKWGFVFLLMGGSLSALVSYYLLERRNPA